MRRPSRIQSTKSSSRYGHALPLSSKFDRSGFTACRQGLPIVNSSAHPLQVSMQGLLLDVVHAIQGTGSLQADHLQGDCCSWKSKHTITLDLHATGAE